MSIPREARDLGPEPPPRSRDGRLRRKAEQFESAMEHHLTPEGLVLTERLIDADPTDPLNAQDAAIWTGCYVAAEACRWFVTRDPAALARFPFPKRDETVRNSLRRGICRAWFDDRLGHPQACAPLPVDERPRSSFEWSSNPYRLDREGDPRVALAGVDYLLAYWLGRRHGILSDAD